MGSLQSAVPVKDVQPGSCNNIKLSNQEGGEPALNSSQNNIQRNTNTIYNTRSLVCGPWGLLLGLPASFWALRPFDPRNVALDSGKPNQPKNVHVSMMHVSKINISMMHVSMMLLDP